MPKKFLKSNACMPFWENSRHTHAINRGCRRTGAEAKIKQMCINELFITKDGTRESVVKKIRDSTLLRPEEVEGGEESGDIFDLDPTKIVLRNGVWDVLNQILLDFSPELRATIKHPIIYDPNATCERTMRLINSSLDGDEKKINNLLDMMALCFIKLPLIQKGFILYGKGANGKGTIFGILRNMLGKDNIAASMMGSLSYNNWAGFELYHKSACIGGDGGTEPIEHTGTIKSILANDAIRCEEKYHNAFSYVPYATIIQAYNELPPVRDNSGGFFRKIELIRFDKSFYGDEADVEIDTIKDDPQERAGLFNLLIPRIKRLLETKKLTNPTEEEEIKLEWIYASDSIERFGHYRLIKGKDLKMHREKAYEEYLEYCDECGLNSLERNDFVRRLLKWVGVEGRKGRTRVDGETDQVFWGVMLRSDFTKETGQETIN